MVMRRLKAVGGIVRIRQKLDKPLDFPPMTRPDDRHWILRGRDRPPLGK